jgi:quinol monooxygenase YgiN
MENIILHVTYTCLPGKAEEFVTALKESGFQTTVRAEDGCIQYDYHLSCEEKDTVVLIERWRDAAALAAHAAAPHMARIAAMKDGRVSATDVKRYE